MTQKEEFLKICNTESPNRQIKRTERYLSKYPDINSLISTGNYGN